MKQKSQLLTLIVSLTMLSLAISSAIYQSNLNNRILTPQGPSLPRGAVSLISPNYIRDGSGNNVDNPTWNKINTGHRRFAPAAYADGSSAMVTDRPNPRSISNVVGAIQTGTVPTDPKASVLFTMWGQFIDHDITLGTAQTATSQPSPPQTASIPIPTGDPNFDPTSTGTAQIAFTRRQYVAGSNPRIAINTLPAWIDGSMVYGPNDVVAATLRTFQDGKMINSTGNLLPIAPITNLFLTGDVRANQNIVLSSIHTIWVRQHNRLCDQLLSINPSLNDTQVFNAARTIVAALIAHITYDEWLPIALGQKLYQQLIGQYRGYDAEKDPRISIEFDTAAFRFGHSLLVSLNPLKNNTGGLISTLNLTAMFRSPTTIINNPQIIDQLMNGLSTTPAKKRTCTLINQVRNLLVQSATGIKVDLFSLNVQRGRDNGLPDYSSMRVAMGLSPKLGFSDITSNPDFANRLSSIYPSFQKLDAFVGMICQDSQPGAVFGRLSAQIIGRTFKDLRSGDRFWYQNIMSQQLINYIQKTQFAEVVNRNTDTNLNKNLFSFDKNN